MIELESRWLRVQIDPTAGGKIWEITPHRTGRNLLWQHPDPPLPPAGFQNAFEDVWTGGWDELFPNDSPCVVDGRALPDHGEWWSRPWSVRRLDDRGAVSLSLLTECVPVHAEKLIRLDPDRPVMTTTYRIENRSHRRIPFLWAQHPALAITPAHRIDLPTCTLIPDKSLLSARRSAPERFQWPGPTGGPDLRTVPSPAGLLEGYIATDLEAGWAALTDTASGTGVGFIFPTEVFRSIWLWLSYGGWRGQYVALLEPSAGYPWLLPDAMQQGTCAWLEPGAVLETWFTVICYEGVTRVKHIDGNGTVHGA